MNNLLIVDDHQIIRAGIRNVLADLYKQENIFEAIDEETAIEALKARPYQLIISDVKMPGSQPFGLIRYITTRYPASKVIIFSMNEEHLYARRFLEAGASGFVSKNADLAELKKAIHLALSNRKYISDTLKDQLVDMLSGENGSDLLKKLSPREFEVSSLLVEGQSAAAIAQSLSITESTVATLKSRIYKKLGVSNLLQLAELVKQGNHPHPPPGR